MQLEFIQELTEARMFRGRETLANKSVNDIAKIVFLTLLIVEILRTLKPAVAKKYGLETLSYENFKTMRNNATDLHNLLAVLNNQNDYAGRIQPDTNVSIPALQIRRYLRDLEYDKKEKAVDRQFFYKLESFLKISDSEYKELRRSVVDWEMNSAVEKRKIMRTIKQDLNKLALQLDILQQFKTLTTD